MTPKELNNVTRPWDPLKSSNGLFFGSQETKWSSQPFVELNWSPNSLPETEEKKKKKKKTKG